MAQAPAIRRLLLASFALASALALAGCTPGSGPIENFPGLPVLEEEEGAGEEGGDPGVSDEEPEEEAEEPEEPTGDEPFVQYLGDGGRIAVTIWGSSTCPVIPTEVRVIEPAESGNAIEFVLPEPTDQPCTADFVPHTTVFSTPLDTTTTEPLEVTVGEAQITVPVK